MRALLLAAVGAALLLGPATSQPAPPGVVELTNANFHRVVDGSAPVLLEFYAPWCPHCKKFEPEYTAVATALHSAGVRVGRVDGAAHSELADAWNILGYPTLLFLHLTVTSSDQAVEFEGNMKAKDVASWTLERLSSPPPAPVAPTPHSRTDQQHAATDQQHATTNQHAGFVLSSLLAMQQHGLLCDLALTAHANNGNNNGNPPILVHANVVAAVSGWVASQLLARLDEDEDEGDEGEAVGVGVGVGTGGGLLHMAAPAGVSHEALVEIVHFAYTGELKCSGHATLTVLSLMGMDEAMSLCQVHTAHAPGHSAQTCHSAASGAHDGSCSRTNPNTPAHAQEAHGALHGTLLAFGGLGSDALASLNFSQAQQGHGKGEGWRAHSVGVPARMGGGGVVAVGRRVFCFGGVGQDEELVRAMFVYDVDAGVWSQGADMPVPLSFFATGLLRHSHVVVVGGSGEDGEASAQAFAYDVGEQQWWAMGRMVGGGRVGAALGVVGGGEAYVVCGMGSHGSLVGSVERFQAALDLWDEPFPPHTADMPSPRVGCGVGVWGHRLVVAGGMGEAGTAVSTVEILDVSTGAWTVAAPLARARSLFATAVGSGALFVLGGNGEDGQAMRAGEVLRLEGGAGVAATAWQPIPSMEVAREAFGAAWVADQ